MATLTDVYNRFAWDSCEDNGLVLGCVSVAQFLDDANLTLLDFLKQSGCLKRCWTMSVFAGVPTYTIPDDLMNVEAVFLAGRWLPKVTVADLNNTHRSWRRENGIPVGYYTDNLPPKTIGLAPAPDYNSLYIPGPNEPDPPHGQYDSFSVTANSVTYTPDQHRGLTMVGTRKTNTQMATVNNAIPLLPGDIALTALLWGIHERVFSSDCENKNSQAAAFSHAQYQECVNLMAAISGEPVVQDKQNQP
jgi:hypothetical protein